MGQDDKELTESLQNNYNKAMQEWKNEWMNSPEKDYFHEYQDHLEKLDTENRKIVRKDMSTTDIKYKLLSELAHIPTKAHEDDAGFDLYSTVNLPIYPGEIVKIPTDVSFEIPSNMVGLIYGRSGLESKGVCKLAGVIDPQYRGNIIVCLTNHSLEPQHIEYGQRIAQIIFHELPKVRLVESKELSETERGEKGFGSSG